MADEIDVDKLGTTLADKIARALGRNPATGDEDDGDDYGRGRSVPRERLNREIDRRKRLEADLAELQTSLQTLQDGYTSQIEAFKAATAEQVKGLGQRHAEDIALIDAGLTDAMGRQVVRQAWEAAPKDARGRSPAEWWGQTLEAHRAHLADPETAAAPTVPRPLTPYLPAAEAPAPSPAPAQRPGSRPPREPQRRESVNLDSLPDDDVAGFLAGLARMG